MLKLFECDRICTQCTACAPLMRVLGLSEKALAEEAEVHLRSGAHGGPAVTREGIMAELLTTPSGMAWLFEIAVQARGFPDAVTIAGDDLDAEKPNTSLAIIYYAKAQCVEFWMYEYSWYRCFHMPEARKVLPQILAARDDEGVILAIS